MDNAANNGPISLVAGEMNFDPNQPIKGDFQLSVNVSSAAGAEQDISGVFQTDPTGSIQMKLIGLVQLKGLTPLEASDKIASMLKPYIKDPKVVVAIVSIPHPVVFFSGAVTRVGSAPVGDSTSLGELLTIVGFSDNADLSQVRVMHRDDQGNRTTRIYNMLKWLKPNPGMQPDDSQNPVLSDKDFIFVPYKTLPGTGNVMVEGDVVRPGVVPLRFGVPTTLREAVSMAGGPNPTADRKVVSIRRLGDSAEMYVDYDKMEANASADNITLQPDDIIYFQKLATNKFINLNGAFFKPGKLPYNDRQTLTQAISEAGGLTPLAKEKEGRIFRHIDGADPTKTQIIAFDYTKLRTGKQPDIMLEPGDTVEVPTGLGPRPPLDPFQITSSLLSIALILDRLFSGRTY
jgi:protein involved in polysaccharide export with SLBB domain